MADDPRTDSAREHDDSDLIEGMIPAGDAVARSAGGQMAQDVGSRDELTRAIDDSEAQGRVTKRDDIDHGQSRAANRGPDR